MDFFFFESNKCVIEFSFEFVKEVEDLFSDGVTLSLLFGVGG